MLKLLNEQINNGSNFGGKHNSNVKTFFFLL